MEGTEDDAVRTVASIIGLQSEASLGQIRNAFRYNVRRITIPPSDGRSD